MEVFGSSLMLGMEIQCLLIEELRTTHACASQGSLFTVTKACSPTPAFSVFSLSSHRTTDSFSGNGLEVSIDGLEGAILNKQNSDPSVCNRDTLKLSLWS